MLSDNFFKYFWEERPILLKGLLSPEKLFPITKGEFFKLCVSPILVRAYQRVENEDTGSALSTIIDDYGLIKPFYESALEFKQPITLLLNNVEKVSKKLLDLRDSFNVKRSWRYDDIVLTLSNVNSGIGFHAGHEDGFICQMKGKRIWNVYEPSTLSPSYIRSVLGSKEEIVSQLKRPKEDPILSVILEPGDVLYLPPLYGHEGITLEESISASIAWRGITPGFILTKLGVKYLNLSVVKDNRKDFFKIYSERELAFAKIHEELIQVYHDRFNLDLKSKFISEKLGKIIETF
ncbi:JmjC domain-containing protein [Spirosoma radiotolerans]|uniref:JmjC domain-containing protein n=1 Tax=Spirosoma radiotolerans TaxID=1379870 RepID=A0A0E3V8P9_9BACT|nr:cupin domain-containing protein [Spirosoma radiotolerans]AKD56952.1 hypothetical protein SD10_20645 [Spirosoma radiotolerans]